MEQEELKAKVRRRCEKPVTHRHVLASGAASTHPILKREVSRRTAALGGDRRGKKGKGSKAVHGLYFGCIVDNNNSSTASNQANKAKPTTEKISWDRRRTYRYSVHKLGPGNKTERACPSFVLPTRSFPFPLHSIFRRIAKEERAQAEIGDREQR